MRVILKRRRPGMRPPNTIAFRSAAPTKAPPRHPFARPVPPPSPPPLRATLTPRTDGLLEALVVGHFNHTSGLKQAALGTIESLRRVGVDVGAYNIPVSGKSIPPSNPKKNIILHIQPDSFELRFDVASAFPPDCKKIAVWFWETEIIPSSWAPLAVANGINEIWAPTSFVEQAFGSFPVPVVKVLPGIEIPDITPCQRNKIGVPDDAFIFLFCFDAGSILERKNPYAVIRAFKDAFPDENAFLIIKVLGGTKGMFSPLPSNILVIESEMAREDVLGLIASSDCFVSMHRSEGFGLLLAEAMLLAKPVIATGYSGNLDFMNETNSFLIEHTKTTSSVSLPFYGTPTWAEPSISHATSLMRFVYENQETARTIGKRAQLDTRALLSFEATGQRMITRLIH